MNEKKYATSAARCRGVGETEELAMYIAAMTDKQQEREMTRAQRVILRAMRRTITQRQLECLEMYYLQGYTQGQIVQRLSLASPSAACGSIQRGREKMRQMLDFAHNLLEAYDDDQN